MHRHAGLWPTEHILESLSRHRQQLPLYRLQKRSETHTDPKWGNQFVLKNEADRERCVQESREWMLAHEQTTLSADAGAQELVLTYY